MERVHLCSDLIYEALKEFIYGVDDDLAVVNDRVDEAEEVVGKGVIGWFERIEKEMGDLHAKAGLLRGGGAVECGKGCCGGVCASTGRSRGRSCHRASAVSKVKEEFRVRHLEKLEVLAVSWKGWKYFLCMVRKLREKHVCSKMKAWVWWQRKSSQNTESWCQREEMEVGFISK